MRVGLVGGRGFIGGHLAGVLARAGYEVLPVQRDSAPPAGVLDFLIDCNGDARRFWANANPEESFRANVLSVSDRLSRWRYERYIYLSTIDVYGAGRGSVAATREDQSIAIEGLDTYGLHKFLAECLVMHHATQHLILRLGTVVGPGLKKNPLFDAVHGRQLRQTTDSTLSLVDLATIGQALVLLLETRAHGIFNLTARQPISIGQILALVRAGFGGTFVEPSFAPSLLHTRYDICTARVESHLPMPLPETIVNDFVTNCRNEG